MEFASVADGSAVSQKAFWTIMGGMASWLAWLTIQYINKLLPTYKRIFGNDSDDTKDGHLVETREGFERMEDRHEQLDQKIESTQEIATEANEKVDHVSGQVEQIGDRQDIVFQNLEEIGEAVDADVITVSGWKSNGFAPKHSDD